MKCPKCGSDCGDYKFCGQCGTPLFTKCKLCHKDFSLDNRFCPFCGKDNFEQEQTLNELDEKTIAKYRIVASFIGVILILLLGGFVFSQVYSSYKQEQYRIEAEKITKQQKEVEKQRELEEKINRELLANQFIQLGSFGIKTFSTISGRKQLECYYEFKPYKNDNGDLLYSISGVSKKELFVEDSAKTKYLEATQGDSNSYKLLHLSTELMIYKPEIVKDYDNFSPPANLKYDFFIASVPAKIRNVNGLSIVTIHIDYNRNIEITEDKYITIE